MHVRTRSESRFRPSSALSRNRFFLGFSDTKVPQDFAQQISGKGRKGLQGSAPLKLGSRSPQVARELRTPEQVRALLKPAFRLNVFNLYHSLLCNPSLHSPPAATEGRTERHKRVSFQISAHELTGSKSSRTMARERSKSEDSSANHPGAERRVAQSYSQKRSVHITSPSQRPQAAVRLVLKATARRKPSSKPTPTSHSTPPSPRELVIRGVSLPTAGSPSPASSSPLLSPLDTKEGAAVPDLFMLQPGLSESEDRRPLNAMYTTAGSVGARADAVALSFRIKAAAIHDAKKHRKKERLHAQSPAQSGRLTTIAQYL